MDKIEKYGLLIVTTLHLETRHIFKSCNIYLKPELFCKSKFMLSKKKKMLTKTSGFKYILQLFNICLVFK